MLNFSEGKFNTNVHVHRSCYKTTNHLQATGYILFSHLLQSVVEEEEVEEEENDTAQEYRNDGYIELVLKVMARMCDGQNHQLQVK